MSQIKFGRNYNLVAQRNDGTFLNINLPFTIEFALTRSSLGSVNSAQIRIYNLDADEREQLRYDWSNYSQAKFVKLNAGYGDDPFSLPLIFYGTVSQAWSYREGVDFITTLECQDGAYCAANSTVPPAEGVFPANTPWRTVYTKLMSFLDFVNFGEIGNSFIFDNNKQLLLTQRSNSYTGNVMSILKMLTGNAFYIDNAKSYILTNEEFSKIQSSGSNVAIIDKSSGLLNTPLIEEKLITLYMVFEPSLFVGQLIKLRSESTTYLNNITINNQVNNSYKISSLKHRATISPVVCGDAITTVQFYAVNASDIGA